MKTPRKRTPNKTVSLIPDTQGIPIFVADDDSDVTQVAAPEQLNELVEASK